MGFLQSFLPKEDRFAALMLYGMVFSTCFNGYDAGIMTVILADKQFIQYYSVDTTRSGVIATIPWASTGTCSTQLSPKSSCQLRIRDCQALRLRYFGGPCWSSLGTSHIHLVDDHWCHNSSCSEYLCCPYCWKANYGAWIWLCIHCKQSICCRNITKST